MNNFFIQINKIKLYIIDQKFYTILNKFFIQKIGTLRNKNIYCQKTKKKKVKLAFLLNAKCEIRNAKYLIRLSECIHSHPPG